MSAIQTRAASQTQAEEQVFMPALVRAIQSGHLETKLAQRIATAALTARADKNETARALAQLELTQLLFAVMLDALPAKKGRPYDKVELPPELARFAETK